MRWLKCHQQDAFLYENPGQIISVGERAVSAPDFGSHGPGFKSCRGWNSARDCTALHCAEPFIITFPLPRQDLKNVERDVKCQMVIR